MSRGRRAVRALLSCAAGAGLAATLGCATPSLSTGSPASIAWGDYQPDRRDYAAFRAAYPEILDPNYLPFMVHRFPIDDAGGDAMVFCRWAEERFPLRVYIAAPVIPEALQDEFHPKPPEHYVTAVRVAVETWERNLEGLVRFRYVDTPEEADVRVELRGEVGPVPEADVRVLGATPLGGACRVRNWDPDAERLVTEFDVATFRVFVADENGLLEPGQVERLALHELGHVLGMSRHSPIPGDLMYPVARDGAVGEVLSNEDINSFVSLYRLESGTVYMRMAQVGSAEASPAPAGPAGDHPALSVAPHVDPRFGYEIHLPRGWTRIETSHGVIAVHGVAWDYDASFQVIVRRHPSIDSYLQRHAAAHLRGGVLVDQDRFEVAGRPGLRWVVRNRLPGATELLSFLEVGDGRVLIVIADCASEQFPRYEGWFEAAVASLEFAAPASPTGLGEE